jgi:hypothetical protein
MRYHLESYLPIEAFKPRGGVGGMTLHGGGGGVISAVTDTISNALGTAGGESGILGGLADFDDAVATSVDGGWAGLAEEAAVIAATYLGGPLGGAAARGALEYTHGGEDRENALRTAAEQAAVSAAASYSGGYSPLAAGATKAGLQYTHGGEDRKNALKSGLTTAGMQLAMQGAKDYLSSSDIEAPVTDNSDFTYSPDTPYVESPYINSVPPDMDLGASYIDAPDGANLLTPDSTYTADTVPADVTASVQPPVEVITPDLSVFNPYVDSPDGLTQLGYSPDQLATITSSSQPPLSSFEQEKLKDDFFKEFVNNPQNPRPGFFQDPVQNISNRALDALDYVKNAPEKTYDYLTKTPIKEMGSDLYDFAGRNKYELGLGALALSSMSGRQPQPQPQPSPTGYYSEYGPYTGGYGSSGGVSDPYLLRNRVTASNVYNYRNPNTSRYAEGGEVKHFAFGGISNALTRFTQPIEKAIVQPVGQALPFLRDAAPYAGILAAPFITSPFAAAGVGALSSGFGRPGSGFDMKRALMGGIAAYGASTVGAGLEAAGTEPTKPLVDTIGESYAVPGTEVPASTAATKGFFRDTDAMQKGVGNLLSSDSDAAMARFGTRAGTFKSGIPIVMGISGMTAIDEANKMREEAERSAGVGRQEQEDMLARISKGRKRAEQAVRENPYMYAMGGQVDDELGGDYSAMGMDQGNLQKGLFGMGYAEGGQIKGYAAGGMPDFGNGSTFPNLPPMSGPLGAVNPDFDRTYMNIGRGMINNPANTTTLEDLMGGDRRDPSAKQALVSGNDLMSMFKPSAQQNTPQMSPSLDQNPNTSMGGFASPSSFYGGGGGSGLASYGGGNNNAFPLEGQYGIVKMAAGGMPPRFLSGGGDGMSDSIPATIGGTQEARLADGEFVIPADVVSHLGNGSSKAGAKQLYSMMDRIRKARTGNEKQGRQIKPKKMMPA